MDVAIFVWEEGNNTLVALVDADRCSAAVGRSRIRRDRSCGCWGSRTWTDRVFGMDWAVMDWYHYLNDVMCAGEQSERLLIGRLRWRL